MINKDGTIKKVYVRKLWNHVTDTACDGFAGELPDEELDSRIDEFVLMLNDLLKHNREIYKE